MCLILERLLGYGGVLSERVARGGTEVSLGDLRGLELDRRGLFSLQQLDVCGRLAAVRRGDGSSGFELLEGVGVLT